MLSFGDIVVVSFPYADSDGYKYRPAMVVSHASLQASGVCWVAMITTAPGPGWKGDIPIARTSATGLTADSYVRPAKLATVDVMTVDKIGRAPKAVIGHVESYLKAMLSSG